MSTGKQQEHEQQRTLRSPMVLPLCQGGGPVAVEEMQPARQLQWAKTAREQVSGGAAAATGGSGGLRPAVGDAPA